MVQSLQYRYFNREVRNGNRMFKKYHPQAGILKTLLHQVFVLPPPTNANVLLFRLLSSGL